MYAKSAFVNVGKVLLQAGQTRRSISSSNVIQLQFQRDGMLYAHNEFIELIEGESTFEESVRYRTVGDMTCTGAVRSRATTLEEVVTEIAATRITERGETRADDRVTEAAMEDRKREGYF